MREGWEKKKFVDACVLQRGFDLPKRLRIQGNYPLVSSSGIIDTHKEPKVSRPGVVTGRSGSIGSVFFIDDDFFPLNTTLYIKDFCGNDPRFIYYLLESFDLSRFKSGAGVPTLNRNNVHSEYVYVPSSLPEQKRIVAILDKAFKGINQAIANAEKNLANARELFESYLNTIFTQKGDGWEEKKLGEIGKVSMCKRVLKKQTTPCGDIPFYKIGTFGKKANAFITQELYHELKNKYSFPQKGQILLSASGTIGRCVRYDGKPAFFQDSNIVWIDNNESLVSNDYLYFFYDICDWNPSKGATIKRLYNGDLRAIQIPFPPLSEQERIVGLFDKMNQETKRLQSIYQQKLNNLQELKQSILQKAFSGNLNTDTIQ